MKKHAVYLVSILLLVSCSSNKKDYSIQVSSDLPLVKTYSEQAFNEISKEEQTSITKCSAQELIQIYIQSINNHKPKVAIATLSKGWFDQSLYSEGITLDTIVKEYDGIQISNVVIVHDPYGIQNKKEMDFIVSYNVKIIGKTNYPFNEGESSYYVKVIKDQEGKWKINSLSTQPFYDSSVVSYAKQAYLLLDKETQTKVKNAKPTDLLNYYVEGINSNNPNLVVSLFSDEATSSFISLDDAYSKYKDLQITNVKIEKDESYSDLTNQVYFVLTYEVTVLNDAYYLHENGPRYYDVMVKKDKNGVYKIFEMVSK